MAAATQDPEASSDACSYMTPRSIETPVGGGQHLSHVGHLTKSTSAYPETGFSSGAQQIRDPYAVPSNIRFSSKSTKSDGDRQPSMPSQAPITLHHNHHHHHPDCTNKTHQAQGEIHQRHLSFQHSCKDTESQFQTDSRAKPSDDHDKVDSDTEDNGIYTILIRFPPHVSSSSTSTKNQNTTCDGHRQNIKTKKEGNLMPNNESKNNMQRSKSVHDPVRLNCTQHARRTPSIQMLLESPDDENTPMIQRTGLHTSSQNAMKENSILNKKACYSKSLPARGRGIGKGIGSGSSTSGTTNTSSQRSSHSNNTTTHNTASCNSDEGRNTPTCGKHRVLNVAIDADITPIPLDARLVPKQLIKVCHCYSSVNVAIIRKYTLSYYVIWF